MEPGPAVLALIGNLRVSQVDAQRISEALSGTCRQIETSGWMV